MIALLAHVDDVVTPANLWTAWSFEPFVLILLGLTVLIYAWGMRNARQRARGGLSAPIWHELCFIGAMLTLVVALVSPLDALSHSLFSAHMAQHLILMLATAPLLVMSELPLGILWALPRPWAQSLGRGLNRSRAWQALTSPVSAWLLFTIPTWAWHASTLYEAALRNEAVHALEHLVFIITSMLFWWVLFRRSAANHLHYGMAIPYLFATMLQSSILGALMIFTTQPWYFDYAGLVGAWGLTPLQDQQLAGLIMWLPGGVVFTLLTIGYFAAWLRALDQRSLRLDRREETLRTHDETP